MRIKLKNLIGTVPYESGFKKRMRFHQGWWRAFVLAEEQGESPQKNGEVICNTILNGKVNHKNFLSEKIIMAVHQTINERQVVKSGMLDQDRLFNNLLSSQPLCFNFFGELKIDTNFALQVLQQFWPDLTKVDRVTFEYAPFENNSNDNSAFDVAFDVKIGSKVGILGLECKYTDSFSKKEYDKTEYRKIFNKNNKDVFLARYEEYKNKRFNQLFRNQLIAEGLIQSGRCDFAYTGLFCHHDDESALQVGSDFQSMLKNGDKIFKLITFQEFIGKIQRLNLSWEQRELTMLLWARYCGIQLSKHSLE